MTVKPDSPHTTVSMFPSLLFMCAALARREERETAVVFGEEWTRDRERTPAFLPWPRP